MSVTKERVITPNTRQQECIANIDSKIMVLAGPGTGKTFTLIQRVKAMIERNVEPESILCLTFSSAAAAEMKNRLVKEIGYSAAGVAVYTYHSFCMDLIKMYPAHFQLMDNFNLIDATSQRNIMIDVIESCDIEHYRSKTGDIAYAITDILKGIDKIKTKKITKDAFFEGLKTHPDFEGGLRSLQAELDERIAQGKTQNKTIINNIESCKKRIGKAKELWEIYSKYHRKMLEKNFIDFNDMINFVIDIFEEDSKFLKEVAGPYKYLLVDEYQDTNTLQNKIIFKLIEGSDEKNVFVVGDDDQIIYGFQGAERDNLENFLKIFPETKVICLEENNRSTQTILDLSYAVITQDEQRIENNSEFEKFNISKKLTAKNAAINALDKKVKMNIFGDAIQENNWVVENIEKLILSAECPKDKNNEKRLSEIAVICRDNKTLQVYSELLKHKNIPHQLFKGKNIFDIKSVIITYSYLKALGNPELCYDKLFPLLISPPFNFEYADYNLLLEKWHFNHQSFVSNIKIMLDKTEWQSKEKIEKFIKNFAGLRECAANENIKNALIEIINVTGILGYFLESKINTNENITGLKKLVEEAEYFANLNPMSTMSDFIKHLDYAIENGIDINTNKAEYIQNAVQLITYHDSKGREFEHVYLPDLTKRTWESKRSGNEASLPFNAVCDDDTKKLIKKSEQLKLLFVGITRAKHSLTLSYANQIGAAPQQLTEYIPVQCLSDFDVQTFEFNQDENIIEIAKMLSDIPYWKDQGYMEYIANKAKNIQLSPTSLNTYSNCPRNFFYSQILNLDIKEQNWDMANYGTAFHSVLENAVKEAKENGCYASVESMIEFFKSSLAKKAFSTHKARKEFEERGENKLCEYYPKFIETSPENIIELEYSFDNLELENGIINGKIDRIEKFNDGTYGLYDYKTGSAKAKSQIKDGGTYESYLNQLRFYKYAYEKMHNVKVSQVGIISPEDSEGNVVMQLTDQDNALIEEKINTAFKQIHSLEFEAPEQNENRCKFCGYKHICKIDVI